ncbi:bile acid:sodium symporter family protein [Paraoerskovia marina]|uniref:bile acid:sodium symporter family protein n=1 Tax=Paraoerskovia marina TaxID=545619 RepID=UPI0004929503|nr:bile acid:sodium symporter [Paraoerskovia marina]
MDVIAGLFNIVLTIFIVTTMLTAGFNTTFEQLRAALSKTSLVVFVLLVAFVLRPLVGWGVAEVFALAVPAYVAMVLLWSCPGAPFGAKLVMTAKADVQTGAVFQVMMAAIGSLTFAPTANLIIGAADLGDDVSLPVGQLILTVALLQLLPFVIGVLTRHWTPDQAAEFGAFTGKVSSQTFLVVLAGALLGSWDAVVDLFGTGVVLAAIVASVVMIALGWFLSSGSRETRWSTALIEPCSNSGPAFAAVAIAFDNDPEILGAITAILLFQIVVGLPVSSFVGRKEARLAQSAA